jgi:hypothetical protein
MTQSSLLPSQKNFADLREVADGLLKSSNDNELRLLAEVVSSALYRCDYLEREVERLGRGQPAIPSGVRQPA